MTKKKTSYKEPLFLFTSSSMRQAAWAGWHSAFGDKEMAEMYVRSAHSEWIKELGACRRYNFLDRYNNDIWKYIPEKRLKEIVDSFFKTLKKEIKKFKKIS